MTSVGGENIDIAASRLRSGGPFGILAKNQISGCDIQVYPEHDATIQHNLVGTPLSHHTTVDSGQRDDKTHYQGILHFQRAGARAK